MNATHIHNRFAKKEVRRVRFGITRGQAILFLVTFALFFYLLTELVFASVAEGSSPKSVVAENANEAALLVQEVTVRDGDSLWKLSVRYQDEAKMDVGQLIEEIKTINKLDDVVIYPGQTLLIPKQ
jgi:LysM repeat protein